MYSSVFVVLAHLPVSTSTLDTPATEFTANTMLQCWVLLAALIIGASCVRVGQWEACFHSLNHHMIGVCVCVVANVLLATLTCTHMSYCFTLHATAAVAGSIAVDSRAMHSARTVMIISFMAILSLVHIYPLPMHVASAAFFTAQTASPAFLCATFESAHLWATVLVSLTRALAYAISVICQQNS